ncbi:hypothetical protein ACFLR5_00770 [Elusimicrobiota bacterium]
MKQFIILTILLTNLSLVTNAAFTELGYDARRISVGNASLTLADSASSQSNPATLSLLSSSKISFTCSRLHLGLTDGSSIDEKSISMNNHIGYGSIGFGYYSRSLNKKYSETSVTLGYGAEIANNLSGGISLDLLSVTYLLDDIYSKNNPFFVTHGNRTSSISANLGIYKKISDSINIAFSLERLNNPDIGLGDEDRLYRKYQFGINMNTRKTDYYLKLSIEKFKRIFSSGFEKHFSAQDFVIRGGFVTGNNKLSVITAGFGADFFMTDIDYAFRYSLGEKISSGSHYFTLGFGI